MVGMIKDVVLEDPDLRVDAEASDCPKVTIPAAQVHEFCFYIGWLWQGGYSSRCSLGWKQSNVER